MLIVDDEPLVRNFVRNVLTQQGFTILSASSGEEALAISREFDRNIDLLLSDVKMPGMCGPELARVLNADRPEMRVILMTGRTSGEIPHHLRPEVLHKPFVPRTLIARVQSALSGRSAGDPGQHIEIA